jgi:outer membrane protein TolC
MEQARVEVEQAKSALELSKLSLCNQLGRDKATDISVKEDFNFATVTDKDPDFDAAIKENLSVMIAVSNRHSAEYALSSAVSSCLPSVSLSGSLGRGGNRLLPEDTQWSLGLGMSFSIFDGGKSAADILSYTAALNRAKADEKGTIQNTRYSLMSVWNDFKNSVLDLGAQQKYMDSTQENAKIADAQYSTGLIQFNNWTIIQNSLVSYEKSFLSAQANVLTKEAAWIQAKGGTLEDEK